MHRIEPAARSTAAVLLLCALVSPAHAQEAGGGQLREWFRTAWIAAQIGEDQSAHEKELRGYVLYPYLTATRLLQELRRPSQGAAPTELDASIRRFLETQGTSPVTHRLRQAWLLSLGRREQWPLLLQHAPVEPADPTVRCHVLQARLALRQTEGLGDAVVAAWTVGRDMPAACDAIFDWAKAQGLLTAERIERRVQLALDAGRTGLARTLANRLPDERARPLLQVAFLLDSPEAELRRRLAQGLPADNRRVLDAYWKLARRDSEQALELLEPMLAQRQFSEDERWQLRRSAAVGLAFDRKVEAFDAFRILPETALDTAAFEWRVRNALWLGEWAQALHWIELMPPAMLEESRWRYWRARSLELLGRADAARNAYAEVAKEREYYGFLAAERAVLPIDMRHAPLSAQPEIRDALEKNPALVRARELFHCELPDEAGLEWRTGLANAEPAVRQEAARWAASWGWHHQSIVMLAELGVWDDVVLRYPLPFNREVGNAARATGLPEEALYAVLRQESLYDRRAASPAGALGLAQLLLPTAQTVARRHQQRLPLREDLFDAGANITLGALYLRELLTRFKDRWILALAAYNAGPGRIPGWLPQRPVAADIWMENIPYNETRSYVQRILAHRVIFGWRRNGAPLPMLPLLPDVSAPAVAADAQA